MEFGAAFVEEKLVVVGYEEAGVVEIEIGAVFQGNGVVLLEELEDLVF